LSALTLLFSESNTRFLCEVQRDKANAFEAALADVPHAQVGEVAANSRLQITDRDRKTALIDADIAALKKAWQKPLAW